MKTFRQFNEQSAEVLKDYVNKTGVHRDPKYPTLALKKIAEKQKPKDD